MDLTQLYRRCAAEGLPTSVGVMLATIQRVAARKRSNGHYGRTPDLDMSAEQMRTMLTEMSTFCGGYMYAGEWADSPEVGSISAPIRHWSREYDHRDRYRVEYQDYLTEVLSTALVINYGSQSRADDLYTATYHKDGSMWRFMRGFCQQRAINERSGLFLPTGIFQDVAGELGVEPTPTYRALFDAAVEYYYD